MILEPRNPKYQWGQKVKTLIDLYNDGSYPDFPEEALLVGLGTTGEIVQVGTHTDTNTPIYLIEFTERLVVGCLEEEILSARVILNNADTASTGKETRR